jgi:hypothetical protein
MFGLRQRSWRRFGGALAGLALCFQLMLSGTGLLASVASTDPADNFDVHALCLGGSEGKTGPTQPAPAAPTHDHMAFCCLWHHLPAVQPVAVFPPHPAVYARIVRSDAGDTAFVPGAPHDPANARAPPILT